MVDDAVANDDARQQIGTQILALERFRAMQRGGR
jgi:hypothetical protein